MTLPLSSVIRAVEASGNFGAMRFEPGCYAALMEGRGRLYALHPTEILEAITTANRCSTSTAQMIFATSWGVYQDMGFELYGELCVAPDHVPSIKEWFADEDMQDRAFTKWCVLHRFKADVPLLDEGEMARFASLYNGPGDVLGYVGRMKAVMQAST